MDLNAAKGVALVVLFIIPILMGFLALCLYSRYKHNRGSTATLLSYLNCFAGGFFLGTCLLVVLGQGLAKFEEYRHLVLLQYRFPFFEVGIGVGFFLVALTEKLIHLIGAARHKPNTEEKKDEEKIKIHEKTQGSTYSELGGVYENVDAVSTERASPCSGGKMTESGGVESEFGFSLLRVVLLLLALSLHTIFDGLALGLQTEVEEVWTLLLALSIHRSILSTVLAVELGQVFDKFLRPLLALLVFSVASPVGVLIGIGVTSGHVHRPSELLTAAVLQAIATGVFVYVTCFEILERDMVAKNDRPLLRVLIAILGFSVLTAIETAI